MFHKTPVLNGSWRKWFCGQTSMQALYSIFLGRKNHIKCLTKDHQKCFILSNSMYLILHYRAPIPNTYCRCNSTLADVALTKRRGFKDGNVSIVAGVWLSSKASNSACCPTSCLLFSGFNMVLFSRIENP